MGKNLDIDPASISAAAGRRDFERSYQGKRNGQSCDWQCTIL
jgi:hypothetical protein